MCGINGFSAIGGSASGEKNRILIEKMNKRIQHRGPDAEGFYIDDNVSLGHRRLSIIDLSEKGKQPIFNENKSMCIILNGEIYNFQELRKNLEKQSHGFFSNTDSEVVLHLYEQEKEKCLEHLNGIFAFAIWDIKNKELFLARDRVGVKPLYYYHKNGKFIFSSEIKAILEHNIKREVDLDALNHYFRLMYVPAPLTMFKNIYKLKPGHYLKLSLKTSDPKPQTYKYWDVDDFKNIESKQKIIEKIQGLVRQSVRGQLISDRPVGVFLSGGIDSTSVLGVAKEFKSNLKTFSVGFDVPDPHNKINIDLDLARQTSKFYNTEHNELIINSKDILKNIEEVIYHMDEPVAEPTQIATFMLSEVAKKQVAVVLGGDGGDELFGGYKRYYYSYRLSKYLKFLPFLKPKIYSKFMFQEESGIGKILNREINNKKTARGFFKNNHFNSDGRISDADFEKIFMLIDLKTWLVDESLMRTDKMTMAHGLEQRVPILDHHLVELAYKISSQHKMGNNEQGKEIFIEAMKNYLPEHVLKSNKKKVWLTPMSEWLRTDLKNFAGNILSENYCDKTKEYFNFKEIEKIFINHINKKKYNLNLVWALIVFQIWAKKYL